MRGLAVSNRRHGVGWGRGGRGGRVSTGISPHHCPSAAKVELPWEKKRYDLIRVPDCLAAGFWTEKAQSQHFMSNVGLHNFFLTLAAGKNS